MSVSNGFRFRCVGFGFGGKNILNRFRFRWQTFGFGFGGKNFHNRYRWQKFKIFGNYQCLTFSSHETTSMDYAL